MAERRVVYQGLTPDKIPVFQRAAAAVKAPEPEPQIRYEPLPEGDQPMATRPTLPEPVGPCAEDCAPPQLEAQLDLQASQAIEASADVSDALIERAEWRCRRRVQAYDRCTDQ